MTRPDKAALRPFPCRPASSDTSGRPVMEKISLALVVLSRSDMTTSGVTET